MAKPSIYTIGHSNHEMVYFLELLESQQINCVIDVRSVAASAYNPQFNKASLQAELQAEDIVYMHFKEEFGARQESVSVQDEEGQVDFEKFRKTRAFQRGVERVQKGLEQGYRIALMCSEGNPLECHRFSMVAVHLHEIGMEILHILKDKEVLTHQALEEQLLKKFQKKIPQPSLFEPDVDEKMQLEFAYRLHNELVGWKAER